MVAWTGHPRNAPEARLVYLRSRFVPFSMLQLALGASFVVVWLFIGGTVLGDRLAEVRRERRAHSPAAARGPHRARQRSNRRSRRHAVAGA